MKRNQDLSWGQVALAANAPMLIKASMVDGRPEVGILPTGQVTGVIGELPTVAELLERIEADATDRISKICGRTGTESVLTRPQIRSEAHTSELPSLMRITSALFCLNKTNK